MLAAGNVADRPAARRASPLTFEPPRELDEIDAVFVSRKALAAGNVADRPAASASPLTFEPPRVLDEIDAVFVSRKGGVAAGNVAD